MDIYCRNCGNKREDSDKYCSQCGTALRNEEVTKQREVESEVTAREEIAATSESAESLTDVSVSANIETIPFKKIGSSILNITVNMISALFILIAYSFLKEGGEDSTAITILVISVLIFLLSLFLNIKKQSYTVWTSSLISIFCIWPTYVGYEDFKEWLEYEGYQTQMYFSNVEGIMIAYLLFFMAVPILTFLSRDFYK